MNRNLSGGQLQRDVGIHKKQDGNLGAQLYARQRVKPQTMEMVHSDFWRGCRIGMANRVRPSVSIERNGRARRNTLQLDKDAQRMWMGVCLDRQGIGFTQRQTVCPEWTLNSSINASYRKEAQNKKI